MNKKIKNLLALYPSRVIVPPPRFTATGGELLSQLARIDVRLGCHWFPTPTPRL